MKKSGNKWSTEKCGRCGEKHDNYSGKLDSKGIEYVVCGVTHKRMNVSGRGEEGNSGLFYTRWIKDIKYKMDDKEVRRLLITHWCFVEVGQLFADACNPKKRTPLFSWEVFPRLMAGSCEILVKTHLKDYTEEEKDYCRELGVVISTEYIKKAGFLDKE